MRLVLGVLVAIVLAMVPRNAAAQTSLDGFGALALNQVSSLDDSGMPLDFGGRVSFEVAPGLQLMGEFGRLGNVLPEFVALPLSFAPFDLKVSAFYGEGGVRLLTSSHSSVRPYVEGSIGVANLSLGVNGLGSTGDAIARAALNFVDSRDPIVGGGGGVLVQAGALQVDLGYRYKRILTNSTLSNILSLGQNLQSHQVRFGVGVRF